MQVQISGEKKQFFWFEICLPFSKWLKNEILVSKYGHLMLPEAFQDQVNPDIDFTDEAVVQCDVSAVKRLLQVLVI